MGPTVQKQSPGPITLIEPPTPVATRLIMTGDFCCLLACMLLFPHNKFTVENRCTVFSHWFILQSYHAVLKKYWIVVKAVFKTFIKKSTDFVQNVHKVLKELGNSEFSHLFLQNLLFTANDNFADVFFIVFLEQNFGKMKIVQVLKFSIAKVLNNCFQKCVGTLNLCCSVFFRCVFIRFWILAAFFVRDHPIASPLSAQTTVDRNLIFSWLFKSFSDNKDRFVYCHLCSSAVNRRIARWRMDRSETIAQQREVGILSRRRVERGRRPNPPRGHPHLAAQSLQ